MRIIGLDYGTKTVGVAVSDALGHYSTGLLRLLHVRKRISLRQTLCKN